MGQLEFNSCVTGFVGPTTSTGPSVIEKTSTATPKFSANVASFPSPTAGIEALRRAGAGAEDLDEEEEVPVKP